MNALATDSWTDLFEPARGASGRQLVFHEVRRGGTPLLYLPENSRGAIHALSLYPAQSGRARIARSLLATALRFGLRPGLKRVDLHIAERDAFSEFLGQMAATNSLPAFAVFAGNPRAPGRRFVFMLLNATNEPQAIVKAGSTETAQALIEHEETFLKATPAGAIGLPTVKDGFKSARGRGFAMKFVEGDSPLNVNPSKLGALMTSWLDTSRKVKMCDLTIWQRLLPALQSSPTTHSLVDATFHPALMHGDFAPWNVKAHADNWTVLDWERGELQGIPAWDWFHFELQPALLVRRETADELFERCEQLLRSSAFLAYAQAAGIATCCRELLLAYLANCLRVTKQTEGRECLLELEQKATALWLKHPAQ